MMKKIIDETMEVLASEMRKDGAFEEFIKEIMNDKGFVEFLKQKEKKKSEEKKSCDCANCKLVNETIENFQENVIKLAKSKNIEDLEMGIYNEDNVEFMAKKTKTYKKELSVALTRYMIHVIALNKLEENSND